MRVHYTDRYTCDGPMPGGRRHAIDIEFLDVDGEPDTEGVMVGGPSRKGEDGAIRCLGCDEDFCKDCAVFDTGYCRGCFGGVDPLPYPAVLCG